MNEAQLYIEKEFLNEPELIDKITKRKTLDNLKIRIKKHISAAKNKEIKLRLNTLLKITEDAYVIDLYSFQFKILSLSLQKEITSIQEEIKNGA